MSLSDNDTISSLRREYRYAGLSSDELTDQPMPQFARWLQQAAESGLQDPNAMVLASVGADGQPNQRTVLLKYYDEDGFVFFTNTRSSKAGEIAFNHRVSLLFPWLSFDRQVIVHGEAQRVSTADAVRYFATRPHDSQLAAWVSNQSQPLTSRQVLLQKFEEMKRKFANGEIPTPSTWGGYRVRPQRVEFWQGREKRLHDRFEYKLEQGDTWRIQRLAP
jgi:pyridoxamine 5'-phosphate oxidase